MIHHPIVLGAKFVFLIVIAVVLLILKGILTPEQFRIAFWVGVAVFIVGTVALWVFLFRALRDPNSRLGRQMIHHHRQADASGAAGSDRLPLETGARGVTTTPLRPAGTAVFGQERRSVVAEGGYIEAGTQVEIVSVKGARLLVRPIYIGQT